MERELGQKTTGSVPPQSALTANRLQPDEDARCVAAVLKGERERFTELIERYQNAVLAVLRGYIRDPHDAEDAAQEVFTNAYSSLAQLRDARLFFSWLLQIARHHAQRSAQRRQKSDKNRPLSGEEPARAEREQTHERSPAVMEEIEKLPEPYRSTIILKYERKLSCREIAQDQGVAIGTITSRLTRALMMLREALKKDLS